MDTTFTWTDIVVTVNQYLTLPVQSQCTTTACQIHNIFICGVPVAPECPEMGEEQSPTLRQVGHAVYIYLCVKTPETW